MRNRNQAGMSTTVPAPVGGLNDRDSLARMPIQDARILSNWWPYPGELAIRRGSANHVTGFPGPVETLVEYLPTSGVSTLFAASGTAIYNATTAGTVGAPVQTGLANARWQDAQINTPGGSFLYLVNGADSPRLWNGATWTTITGVSTPSITGVTTSLFVHACVFKNRLFFVERDSMRLWYLPVNSVGGAAASLDLGAVFRMGGSIQAIYPWTLDGGQGADDFFVVLSTNGEAAVYRGTDPASSSTWNIAGVYSIGRTLGRRCGIKFGGDLAVNTTEGVFPMSKALLSVAIDRREAMTDKIQNSVSVAANQYETNFGWQLCLFPEQNMLIMNVPAGDLTWQFAQNTITGAWTKFNGWRASCWLRAATGLYFGGSNVVRKAWTGALDVAMSITADMGQAFSTFRFPSNNKLFTMVRPYFFSNGTPSILYSLDTDFESTPPNGVLSGGSPSSGMVWGSMVWGSMVWGGAMQAQRRWQSVGRLANAAAIRIVVQNNGADVRYVANDFVYQPGGVL